MTLIFQPTVNSRRRFAPGTVAAPCLARGNKNRTICLRLVGHDLGRRRVENRPPGADSNPDLTTAATLAAGVAGILNRIGPAREDIGSGYTREPARALARGWLGDRFVDGISATRAAHFDEFRRKVPDVELQRFFDLG